MTDIRQYTVVRRHIGDRPYDLGDIREGKASELDRLVPKLLQPLDQKAQPAAPKNKAEQSAPANKAQVGTSKRAKAKPPAAATGRKGRKAS